MSDHKTMMANQAERTSENENGHGTAEQAVDLLLALDGRYRRPTPAEKRALLIGFAMQGKTLNGAAFDIVRNDRSIDLSDAEAISKSLDHLMICEIKATRQPQIGDDLHGYFFNITAAEFLTAQNLGDRFRFVFVNVATRKHQEMALSEIFGKARGLYPAWHIRFWTAFIDRHNFGRIMHRNGTSCPLAVTESRALRAALPSRAANCSREPETGD